MFIDKAQVQLKAGKGGDGVVSFRHEIYVDKGGPDGGDGGRGGDIILKASRNENTLSKFRFKKSLIAEDGKNGSGQNKRGRKGNNLVIKVPVGTVVLAEDGQPIVDLVIDNQGFIVAKGGDGGFGNAHFTSSVRQAPKVAEKGEPGDELLVTLELKIIADVGLVGLPNAGKSTFLSVVSNARPEIANYPFTTLKPNLGVVDLGDDNSLLIADIPGLIEGASEGKGLGDEFLRHVSRCQVLLHLIDSTTENITQDYQVIRNELENYSFELASKPEIVALTKVDLIDAEIAEFQKEQLESLEKPPEVFYISAQAHIQIKELLAEVFKLSLKPKLDAKKLETDTLPVITLTEKPDSWKLVKKSTHWQVTGRKIEKFAKRTDYDNEYGITRLRDIMKKMGILRELDKRQAQPGEKIVIGQPKIGEIVY